LANETGILAPGLACDLAVWNVGRPVDLAYRIGFNPLHARIFGGLADERQGCDADARVPGSPIRAGVYSPIG
jgi:hypothetical protein